MIALACAALAVGLGASAASASSLATLYTLDGVKTGMHPQSTLAVRAGGQLVGTSAGGGLNSLGAVFALTPAGTHYNAAVLHAFKGGTDGASPDSGLAAVADGSLYGVTPSGGGTGCGGSGCGVIYRMIPPVAGSHGWQQQVLYRFTGAADGGVPEGALAVDAAGMLYGTTSTGGAGYGTVFSLTAAGPGKPSQFATLYTFQGGSDGAAPQFGPLLAGAGGTLFGTTFNGGLSCVGSGNGCGTVFSLTPPAAAGGTWTESVLYRFTGGTDGGFPPGGLTAGPNGSLIGVTDKGRTIGRSLLDGTVFQLSPAAGGGWSFATLYSFGIGGDGATPNGPLVADAAGNLFGLTVQGGNGGGVCLALYGCGTAFKLAPPVAPATAWTETVLYRFGGAADAAMPEAGLTPDGAGNYLGTASSLMLPGSNGTVFKLTP